MFKTSYRRGVAAVEAAVCLPVLAVIIFGAVEISSGIFHEYNAQAAAYELSKVALRAKSTCTDVQTSATTMLPGLGFDNYSIKIEVEPRTVNQSSVVAPDISTFDIPKSGLAPVGLEEIPRGTLLKLTLTADRPVQGIGNTYLSNQIQSDCVFVKEF